MIRNLDELKRRIDIVDVIGKYLPLRKNGANFNAICPFHQDTKPSLTVSPSKQIYHCFACGAGGDAIKFVSEYKKLDFEATCEEIAEILNFSLVTGGNGYVKKDYSLLEDVKNRYKNGVFKVIDYLKERGINEESIVKFELGYGESLDDIGFETRREFNLNAFSGRLIFPIKTRSGKVVGFGGRYLGDKKDVAKYINSPQSAIFNKSSLLYGIDLAKEHIIKTRECVVCEGYMDAIAAHQIGVKNTVATLGTALTKEHLAQIVKYGASVTLFFDKDKAGKAAARKAAELLLLNRMYESSILKVDSQCKDIAEAVNNGEGDKIINAAKEPIIKFRIDEILSGFNEASLEIRAAKVSEAARFLNFIDNSFLRREYGEYLKNSYGISEDDLIVKTVDKKPISKSYDLLEAGVIRLMSANPQNKDYVLKFLDEREFYSCKEAFRAVKNDQSNAELREILLLQIPSADLQTSVRLLYKKKLYRLLNETLNDRNIDELEKIKRITKIKKALKDF